LTVRRGFAIRLGENSSGVAFTLHIVLCNNRKVWRQLLKFQRLLMKKLESIVTRHYKRVPMLEPGMFSRYNLVDNRQFFYEEISSAVLSL
jgi:hypothetical protein